MKTFRLFLSSIFLFVLFSNFSNQIHQKEETQKLKTKQKFQIAYTMPEGSNLIIPIDLETGENGNPLSTEHYPKSILIKPDTQTAYVMEEDANEIHALDLSTGKIKETFYLEEKPKDFFVSEDEKSAFIIFENSKKLSKLNLENQLIEKTKELKNEPHHIRGSKQGQSLIVSYLDSKTLSIHDLETCLESVEFNLNSEPLTFSLTNDHKMIFIGKDQPSTVSYYDLKNQEEGTILECQKIQNKKIQNIHLSADNKIAYLTYEEASEITSIDLEDLKEETLQTTHEIKNMVVYPRQELKAKFSKKIAPAGEESHFDASKTETFNGKIVDYTWNFGDGHTLTTKSPKADHTYNLANEYDVTLTVRESIEDFPLENYKGKSINKEKFLKSISKKSVEVIDPLAPFPSLLSSGTTSTTISSSSQPSVFGESITFSSTVTSLVDPGTPTGTVQFVDTTLGLIGSGTLNGSGIATYTTSSLSVGTYALAANYLGDGTFLPSSSSPPDFTQNVNKALTSTQVTGTPNPSFYGNSVTFTATISIISPGAGTVTGTVTFFDGATSLGSSPVSSGQATLSLSNLTPGLHNITATYSGDADFLTSTSTTWLQTVNQAVTSTNLASSQNPSYFGNSVTFTATVSVTSGTGTPTGTVTFKNGATTLSTQTLSSGVATFSTSSLSVGTQNITATYNTDGNFAGSISNTVPQVINQGTTSTSLTSSVNPSTFGQSTTFTATVSVLQGAGTPTGSITFKDGATTLGTSSINGSGVATLAVSNLSVGSHTISAVYSGDTNFSTSTSSNVTQIVNQATPSSTLASSLNPSNYGDLITFTATFSAPTTLGIPTGTVSFYDGATLLGSSNLSASGANTSTGSFSISSLNAGSHSITAVYSGDTNFISVTTNAISQVVNPVTSTNTIVFSNSQNPSQYGQTVVLRANVTGSITSPPFPPTGFITFFDGGNPIGTVAVTGIPGNPNASTTSLTVTNFTTGSHVITAQYLGDVNYPPSAVSSPMTQVVTKSGTTSVAVSTLTPTVFGQNATFNVTVTPVSPGSGTPSGIVSFYDGATFLGNSSPLTPGVNSSSTTFSTNVLSLGSHIITAIYAGDSDFTSSSAPTITQVVVQDTTTTTITGSTSSPAGFNFGDFITFTAEVTANAPGSGTPTGTVSFYDGSTFLGTGTLSSGTATYTTEKLYPTPPLHQIKAVYSGDTNFIASTSANFPQSISNTLPTTTSVTSSRNSSPGGASVTYTATVVANPGPGQGIPGIPAGTVTFTDTTLGVVIGTATLNGSGRASITQSGASLPFVGPAPDIHAIQATFNGQTAIFDPSTSALYSQYIVPFDTATTLVATPNHSIQAGATLVATVQVLNGPPAFPTIGTVSFYEGSTFLGTVPIGSDGTATLNPNNLHFGGASLVAVYSGDTLQFATSTSNPVSLQVQQTDMLTTSTVLTTSDASTIYCEGVTFTARVTETQGFYTPTGTVTFFSDDASIGTAILDQNGRATLTISNLSVGSHDIQATYNSDSNYAFSFSNTLTQTISANDTTTTLDVIPILASTPYGQNLILSATVTSNTSYNAIPTGSVTFKTATTTLATVDLDSTGNAVFEISTLDTGTQSITATYNPDPCFLTSSDTKSHVITKINPITTLTTFPNPSTYGDQILITATVTSPVGTPTGSVTFYLAGSPVGTVYLQGGTASIEIASPGAGLVVIGAKYSGDANFLAINTPSVLQTIRKAPTSVCLVSFNTNPSVYSEPVTLSAAVSSSAFNSSDDIMLLQAVTGTVDFYNGSTLLGTVPLNDCYTAELETVNLNLGSANNITAKYSGDNNFATSTSLVLERTVVQADTKTTVTSITSTPNPPRFGTLVTFNVEVTPVHPASATPTGSITAYLGSTVLGTGTLSSGIATFATSQIPAGTEPIIIKYSGDTNFNISETVTSDTVLQATTSSTMTSSNNPAVYGQPVTFSVTVTSTQGTPTGTVSFLDGTTTLATETLNSSGAASFTTSSLTIGNHSIRAVYSGSSNLATSTTSTITQVINKASTVTTLKSTPNPSVYGQTTTLVANVSPTSPGNGTPSGTVTFKNGATTIGSSPINKAGNASLDITTSLAASLTPYSLTAVYSGDSNFNTSTGALSQTITKSATNILATYSPNPANAGQAVTINVTVQPINLGVGTPTGTVTALYGSQVVGSGTLLSNGTVSFQTTTLPSGTLGIVIQYQGDSNFYASSAPITETINLASTTTVVTSSINPSVFGQPVTLTATVTSAVPASTPTGTVTFFDGTTIIGTQSLDGTYTTTFTTSNLSVGNHFIRAVYSGDGQNATSTSVVMTQVVNQGAANILLSSVINPSVYGETVTFTAQVAATTPSNGTPTGTVTFKNGATTLGTVTLSANGTALFSTFNLPVGSNSITAVYNGSSSFLTQTSTVLTQKVEKAPTIASVNSLTNPVNYGTSVPISGTISPVNNGSTILPSGTLVTAYYGSTVVGSGTIDANGNYSFNLSNLPSGTVGIELKYPGDGNFQSSSVTLTQTINSDTATISITSSVNPSVFGQSVTFNNTVSLNSASTPTGTVTFFDGATPIGTVNVNQPFTTSSLQPGTHAIKAVYNGSSTATTATSNTINQVVNKSTTATTISSNLNPSIFGNSVTFTSTVTSTTGSPTGFVTFKDGSLILGTAELDLTGTATFSISTLTAGSHSITAVYSGDLEFLTSTSAVLTQIVNKVPSGSTTTTIVSSIPNPSVFGENVNFIANVTSPNGNPTGTVSFYDGATLLSTVPLYDGFAVMAIDSLAPGNHNITAQYNGDTNFNPSNPSAIYLQQVDPVTVTITTVTNLVSLNNPSNFGDPVTFNIQVTSALTPPPYPTGFVTLYTGSVPLVTLPLDSTAHATYTTADLPAGNLQIVALYSGDHAFSASTDVISQIVLAVGTSTTLTSDLNPSTYGDSVTFTATVSSLTPSVVPTGTVSFYEGPTLLQTVLLNNLGVAEYHTSSLSTGTHQITATYNPAANYITSSDTISQLVNVSPTTTQILNSTSNPSNLGDSVTFIANTSSIHGVPTGNVLFYDGATLLGSSPLINGLAFYSTASLTSGSHSITAVYEGNTNFSPSTSAIFTQVVVNQSAVLQPPRGFCGCPTKSEFLNKSYYAIELNWSAPGTGAEPTYYNIYRDPELTDLIATIPACSPLTYIDKKVKKNRDYTYYLVAGNEFGISSYISVTVGKNQENCCTKK